MSEKLVGLLRCGIEADRVVHLIVGGVRNFLVRAVDRGRGGIDEMLNGVVTAHRGAACLKNVVEADYIRLDINVGIGYRVADARLRGEVDDDVEAVLGKERVNELPIGNIALDENPTAVAVLSRKALNLRKAVLLYRHVVVVVHIVKTDDAHALNRAKKLGHKIRADKARRSRDENGFVL